MCRDLQASLTLTSPTTLTHYVIAPLVSKWPTNDWNEWSEKVGPVSPQKSECLTEVWRQRNVRISFQAASTFRANRAKNNTGLQQELRNLVRVNGWAKFSCLIQNQAKQTDLTLRLISLIMMWLKVPGSTMPELFNVSYNMIYMAKTFKLHLSASILINTRVTRTTPGSRTSRSQLSFYCLMMGWSRAPATPRSFRLQGKVSCL